jgi:hypothetical protein
MITERDLFLFKTQPLSINYAAAGTTAMDGTCIIEPLKGSTLECEQDSEEIDLVSGTLDQEPAVPGNKQATVSLNFPMTGSHNDGTNSPYWMTVGQCAGYTLTDGTAQKHTLTPTSSFTTAGTFWKFSGPNSDGTSLLYKAYNVQADWKLSLDAGKAPKMQYTGKGAYYGVATDSTQPTNVTKARVSATAFKSATVTVNGNSYKLISAEISGNQAVAVTSDPSEAGGIGGSEITSRKVKFTAKCYATKAGTLDPMTAIDNSTQGALTFLWGTGKNAISISGNYAQITKCKSSDENGVITWDLEGQCNRNDFTITINP